MIPGGPGRESPANLYRSPRNPRTITPAALEQLKHTLKGNPLLLQARPLIVTLQGEILAGNQRHLAIEEMARDNDLGPLLLEYGDGGRPLRIPIYAGDFSEAERREIMLLDNQSFGSWDDERLAEMVAEHAAAEGDMAMLGFADAELAGLLRLAGADSGGAGGRGLGDPDADPPPPPTVPKSKVGELYLLGEHRLYVGDSTTDEAISALFGGSEVDLVVTDPPYGVNYQGRSIYGAPPADDATPEEVAGYEQYRAKRALLMKRRADTLEVRGDDATGIDLAAIIAGAMGGAPLKGGGSFYVFAPAGSQMPVFYDGLIAAGLPPRHELVWIKDRFALGLSDYHYRHEPILFGWKPGGAHFFVDDRSQDTVWEFDAPRASKHHPTMKPVDLVRRAIRNSSRRGELVYDPFGGSGTTLIAAHAEQRRCRIAEIDPAYADVIIARFEEYTDISAQRVSVDVEQPA